MFLFESGHPCRTEGGGPPSQSLVMAVFLSLQAQWGSAMLMEGFGNKPGPWCRTVPGHGPASLFRPLAYEQIDSLSSLNGPTGAPGTVLLMRDAQEGKEGRGMALLEVAV